jgi:uncharacterized protein GlcG (DUF336 family)
MTQPLGTRTRTRTRALVLLLAAAPWLAAAASSTPADPEAAAPLPTRPQLSLALAQQLAQRSAQACAAQGREIAVAVVDASGQSLLQQRGASVGPHNLEAARRKAYSALSTRQATLALGRAARSQPDTAGLLQLPELLLLGGGLPLWQGGHPIGAIGVAGGGGPEADEACARAAAAALGLAA